MVHHPKLPPGVPADSPLGLKILGRKPRAANGRFQKAPGAPADAPRALVDRLKDGG